MGDYRSETNVAVTTPAPADAVYSSGTYDILTGYRDVLLPEDVMQILKIGRNAIYKMLADGTIKSIRIGKKYRIPKKYLIDFLYDQEHTYEGRE